MFVPHNTVLSISKSCIQIPQSTIKKLNSTLLEPIFISCSETDQFLLKSVFRINKNVEHIIFRICWDRSTEHPVWVRHTINGLQWSNTQLNVIDTGIRTKFRFSSKSFGKEYNPRQYFTKASQRKFNLSKPDGDFLARGHLAAAADFILASERWATYTLENTVPQWQSDNNGDWRRKEERYRNKATENQLAINVFTIPVYNFTPNYLDPINRKLPVPEFMLKIVEK